MTIYRATVETQGPEARVTINYMRDNEPRETVFTFSAPLSQIQKRLQDGGYLLKSKSKEHEFWYMEI